jgi:hypothetical protein
VRVLSSVRLSSAGHTTGGESINRPGVTARHFCRLISLTLLPSLRLFLI